MKLYVVVASLILSGQVFASMITCKGATTDGLSLEVKITTNDSGEATNVSTTVDGVDFAAFAEGELQSSSLVEQIEGYPAPVPTLTVMGMNGDAAKYLLVLTANFEELGKIFAMGAAKFGDTAHEAEMMECQ